MTRAIQEQIVASLQVKYGKWSGFHEPVFVKDETEYKRKIIASAKPFLEPAHLQLLLDSAQYGDFCKQVESAARKSQNLLYMKTYKSGDLRILYHLSEAARGGFCHAFFDLLYGKGSATERFGRYLHHINAQGLPNYWTFPTYFLFVTDPAHDVFVKPTKIEAFLKSIQAPDLWRPTPTAEAYAAIVGVAEELRQALSQFGAADMVDIQSVMYVCANVYSDKPPALPVNLTLGYPFSQIFASYGDACAAFDLLRHAFEYLGVESESDHRFALTIPKSDGRRVLRLNFGNWATIAFYGPQSPQGCIISVALKQGIPGMKSSDAGFEQKPKEPLQLRFYDLPFDEMMSRLTGSTSADFEESFRFIGQRFADWTRCPYLVADLPIVARAVFRPEQRQALLTGGLNESQLKSSDTIFSDLTFKLLAGINAKPKLSYYQENLADFKHYVEEPFQGVMKTVAAKLPPK